MALTALTRLLELVHRTRLPLIVQSSDSVEPCVVLPLSVYERLIGGVPVEAGETAPATESEPAPASLADFTAQIPVASVVTHSEGPVFPEQEQKKNLRLQDLLQPQAEILPKTPISATRPQVSSLEDRFAFDGLDVRILPKIKQKMDSSEVGLDENGQTLA